MGKYSVVCVAVFVAVVSAQYAPRPPLHYGPPRHGGYGGLGGHGGGLDPLTLLLLQKDGGLGGSGGIDSLLPLLLAGGLGGKEREASTPYYWLCWAMGSVKRSTFLVVLSQPLLTLTETFCVGMI